MLGAAALIEFLGPSQLQDGASMQMFLQIRGLTVSTISVHLGPGDDRGIMLSKIATDPFRVPARETRAFFSEEVVDMVGMHGY
jgi:hypothetical protein